MLKRALLCSSLSTATPVLSQDQSFDDTFAKLSDRRWHVAHYDFHHPSFDTDWRRARVQIDHGLRLSLAPHTEGLNRYRGLLRAELNQLGFATEIRKGGKVAIVSCQGGEMAFADHLQAKMGTNQKRRILLNGHMDTVFSKTDPFQKMNILPDGTITGPGVADMKGGILAMIYALRNLNRLGRLSNAQLTVLLNSDEETGSLTSRGVLEELA